MRKRVSRACDECRIHKARCDGMNPCETCQRYDRGCSYDLLPFECKGSAARIRILENRLIKANECITRLKKQAPGEINVAVARSAPHSTETEGIKTRISQPETPCSFDAGNAFFLSLLRPLSYDIEIEALAQSQSARSFLRGGPNVNKNTRTTGFCQLPAYETALEFLYLAFNNTFGLCSIIVEQAFRTATQRLYDLNSVSRTQQDVEFMPLFHAVLALGMIHHSNNQQDSGYNNAVRESLPYFEAAAFTILSNNECSTLPKLELMLCLILYHLGTSRLNLARPMLQVICASSIFHSLLQSTVTPGPEERHSSNTRAKDIVWTIFYMDMHISSLTQSPALLHSPGPDIATVYAVNSAAYNVANCKRSSSTFLLSVSLAMAVELIKLIRRIFPIRTSQALLPRLALLRKPTMSVDTHEWNKVRTELQTWDYMLQNIFPEHEGNMQISLAGSELKIHYCLAEIMLYHNFLQCLAESTPLGEEYEIDDINKGRACVAAAMNAISHISNRLSQITGTTLTWSSAYTVFISSLTLLVAAAFAHANERHTIHNNVYVAIQILQETSYGDSHCKKSYLDFIRILSERVMMPFDFGPVYHFVSSAERSATSTSSTTDRTTSWCDTSPVGALNSVRFQLSPMGIDGGFSDEWGFDGGELME